MPRQHRVLAILLLLALLCTGCVTTSMQSEFDHVRHAVQVRTGHEVAWAEISAPQAELAAHVQDILDQQLTVDGAVRVALLNNRALQAGFAEMGISVGEFIQAGLLPNPVLELAVRTREGQRSIEGSVLASITDIILLPLRHRLKRAELEAAKRHVEADVIDLITDTRVAFWEYLAARQHLLLATDVATASAAAYAMAFHLREAGNVPLLMVLQQRERYERSRLELAEAEMMALKHRERLNILMGLWGAGTLWESADALPPPPELELDLAEIEARAVDASLDLEMATMQLAAAAQRLGIARVEALLPDLHAGISGEREPGEGWWLGPGFELELPLFDQKQGRRAAAAMQVRREWELLADSALRVRAAARLAAYRLDYTRKRAIFLNEVVVPVRHRVLLESHLHYNAMFLGVFDLLREKERELETSRDYIDTLRDYWVTRTQLEQLLMGRLYDVDAMEFRPAGRGAN